MPKSKLIDDTTKLKDFIAKLSKQRAFVFNIETDESSSKILGISFCINENDASYIPYSKSIIPACHAWALAGRQNLKSIFSNPKIKKTGHDLKTAYKILLADGINLSGISFDTMLAAYLLAPGERNYNLETLTSLKLNENFPSPADFFHEDKKKFSLQNLSHEELAKYACEKVKLIQRLAKTLDADLAEANLSKLFNELELPLIPVLAEMETNGVLINCDLLQGQSLAVKKELDALSKKIFKLAEGNFNIDSPIQLREILFEKLKIQTAGISRGKTGISTAASELFKLKKLHPIVPLIMQYRELTKLQSTYLLTLPKLVDPSTGRIHTSFNQAVTSTGRLSSSNPNLQNIPTGGDFEKTIRSAFIAPPKTKILAADYAHIELRVIASLANDEAMMAAFKSGQDIHKQTASQIWGIAPEEVTPAIRRAAKTINFGITYGMGARGLAESAEISFAEAQTFIKRYFSIYEGIKNFLIETKESAHDLGYVETMFGRRRYLPEIFSPIPAVRAEAERMAINMPVQGTAADIIKLAMIKIHKELPQISPGSKMIMQVHDELVFEVPDKDVKLVSSFIKKTMQNIVKLKVPILVDIEAGPTWGDLKKMK